MVVIFHLENSIRKKFIYCKIYESAARKIEKYT